MTPSPHSVLLAADAPETFAMTKAPAAAAPPLGRHPRLDGWGRPAPAPVPTPAPDGEVEEERRLPPEWRWPSLGVRRAPTPA